ncbi:MAG: hypothetical protein GY727_09655 [Gammaproteobacteria bacterium]|nr:hypothetical protein [Gammaproteobacteria bacterium]MCP4090720.1 hypothetical protein [Gammaproteobacteria bacterium]MCP4277147.1 hypothetical protein [Gammaproteobacteria bacterium]MCP4832703.1 hypothetical protein [Gammaproteobacteria bacterium]
MKILHLIEKGSGLQQTPEGYLESCMWPLNSDEQSADYVALHKQKSKRSWKGGRVVCIREVTEEELSEQPAEVLASSKKGRMVVCFEPIREYNGRPGIRWGGSRKGSMAYKSLEIIEGDAEDDLLN